MTQSNSSAALPEIPVFACGRNYPLATLRAFEREAHALIDGATQNVPATALKIADGVSRRWLAKTANPHLSEIDTIASELGRPGAYFLSVNYEWGCTVAVRRTKEHPELVRVLDWRTPGLGRYVIVADVVGPAGRFVALTWPGYTGVLQAMSPGRFAAAINQAPMLHRGGGLPPLDWLANKVAVWRNGASSPAHLLRHAFERSATYRDARAILIEEPVAAPVIFSLVGTRPDELTIIERTEQATRVHDGARAAANAWSTPNWTGHARGEQNAERARQLARLPDGATVTFDWLHPPVLNSLTRLAAVFTPASGRVLARGLADREGVTADFDQQFEQ